MESRLEAALGKANILVLKLEEMKTDIFWIRLEQFVPGGLKGLDKKRDLKDYSNSSNPGEWHIKDFSPNDKARGLVVVFLGLLWPKYFRIQERLKVESFIIYSLSGMFSLCFRILNPKRDSHIKLPKQ